jgi:hypothetical protein
MLHVLARSITMLLTPSLEGERVVVFASACTAHMTPPAQLNKCAASSNGALGFLSASLNRNRPMVYLQ